MLIQHKQAHRTVIWGALCGLLLLFISGLGAARLAPAVSAAGASQVVAWRGGTGDPRWSNPANWQGGRVPSASDTVRLPVGTSDALVDQNFAGQLASITLEDGYNGTLTLSRALTVRGALVVRSGTVEGGADVLRAETMRIEQRAIVRMGANGKLNLTGDGSPLTGDGLLDTTTNAPNSVEFTGKATSDLTAAGPAAAYHALSNVGRQPGSRPEGSPPNVSEVLPLAPTTFTQTSSLTLNGGEGALSSAVIDTVNGFAYFGTCTTLGSAIVAKVRLSDFTRVGALILNTGEICLSSAVIDTTNGFAYFGTSYALGASGVVVKVRLSDFTRAGALTLNPGEGGLTSAVIDMANGFAYFGRGGYPGVAVKVRLSDFTRVDGLTLNMGEEYFGSAVIDTANGFAYFGTHCLQTCSSPGIVVKVRLSDSTRVGGLTLNPGEGSPNSAVIDAAHGFAYFGTFNCPGCAGQVVKVQLTDFTRVAALALDSVRSAVIDPANGFAYFGTSYGYPVPDRGDNIVKVRLSDFMRVDALPLNPGEYYLGSAVIDLANGFAYFGTQTVPGIVVKVNVAIADRLVLTHSASAATANVGDTLTYTLGIVNDSPITATSLTLTDTLPLSVTFVSASAGCGQTGGVVVCNLGDALAGNSTQVTILVKVTGTGTGVIMNTAQVSASEPRFSEPVSASVTTLLNPRRIYFPVAGR